MTSIFGIEELLLSILVGTLALYTGSRHPALVRVALNTSLDVARILLPIATLAIMAASFLELLIPREAVVRLIGAETGFCGILLASLIGAAIPGGPMITFPLVVTFANAGAGAPQLVALISGWSTVALHRLVALEAPLMGRSFVLRRLLATALLPPLSGVTAAALVKVFGTVTL